MHKGNKEIEAFELFGRQSYHRTEYDESSGSGRFVREEEQQTEINKNIIRKLTLLSKAIGPKKVERLLDLINLFFDVNESCKG